MKAGCETDCERHDECVATRSPRCSHPTWELVHMTQNIVRYAANETKLSPLVWEWSGPPDRHFCGTTKKLVVTNPLQAAAEVVVTQHPVWIDFLGNISMLCLGSSGLKGVESLLYIVRMSPPILYLFALPKRHSLTNPHPASSAKTSVRNQTPRLIWRGQRRLATCELFRTNA
jgi:hypothetical protein